VVDGRHWSREANAANWLQGHFRADAGRMMMRTGASRSTGLWVALGALAIVALGVVWFYVLSTRGETSIDLTIDFQGYRYGVPPREFDYDATGSHGPVRSAGRPFWRTYVDLFAPSPQFVLIQAATLAKMDHYPLALLRDVQVADVTLSVYLKPMGGELDQSAGMVWRAQDRDNYYAVLVSALDDRLRLVKMVQGQPHELATVPIEIDVEFERREPTPEWGWYALRIEAQGSHITVWFQDEKVLETNDMTFRRAGRVGLITHADSVAVFDDFWIRAE
jgi:hypothetical protein